MNRQPKGRHAKPAGELPQVASNAADMSISGASSNSGSSWTSSTISGSYPGGQHAVHESRYLEVISRVRGSRGPAVAELARYLAKTGMFKTSVDCAEMSVQLLAVESEETCEAVRVLLEDGWEGDLGELLACARKA